ncbi:hypothetical protein [Sphingomonas sp. BAUL-RG-20F-R05-02]|uniref:hypothetical protein n=1 Tax=Sphingomonas sp. BAUL-RG-20F-R05-02 TaxID=2914830 RepID=UPI001F58BF7B|nr:hypothetical protein [Sphingomonas sp. BAUL-RG-20F-R05-02]
MTPRSIAAAEAGCRTPSRASSHGPSGALFCQIVDRAVKRTHRFTHAALMTHLHDIAPTETYLSLIADDAAHQLYAQ